MADTFPTELIERILEFAASVDAATGHAVCLTNRLGHRVGQPVLYHSLDLGGDNSDGQGDGSEDGDDHEDKLYDSKRINPRIASRLLRWSLLCRTVLENRSLARRVVAIKAFLDDTSDKRDDQFIRVPGPVYYVPALNIKAWKAFMSTELKLSKRKQIRVFNWLEQWVRNGEDDSGALKPASAPDVYLSLLILACPHLRTLRTSGTPPEQLWPLTELSNVSHVLQHKTRPGHLNFGGYPTSGFRNVEEVFLDSGHSSVEVVGQLLRWPALQKFEVNDLGAGNILYPLLGSFFLSRGTEMRITNAIISIGDYSILFGSCTRLKSFFMSWHKVCDVYREVYWHKLGTALAEYNPLLEGIYLDIAHEEDLRDEAVPNNFDELDEDEQAEYLEVNNEGLGSLQGLSNLRKLSVPYVALFGVFDSVEERDRQRIPLTELLPSSLEELDIFCEGADFKDTDVALLNDPGTFKLRDMTIWNCTRDRWISRVHGEGRSG